MKKYLFTTRSKEYKYESYCVVEAVNMITAINEHGQAFNYEFAEIISVSEIPNDENII